MAVTESRCDYCVEANHCESESDDGWACTRVRGHDGPHVACGLSQHDIKRWGDGE